jgi:cell division protein FtsI (penicillin-binding protein 3)
MIKPRLLFVLLVFFIFFIGIVVKLIDIQIIKREELKYFAQRQHLKEETILPERGLIYDRNNILLAYNRNDHSIFLDKRQTNQKSRERLAEQFAKTFGQSKKHYMGLMNSPKNVVCLEKKAAGDKTLYLQSFKEPGLFTEPNPSRIYQYQNLASHLIGYIDADFEGRNGIEQFWNKSLKGIEGKRIIERNGLGDITSIADKQTRPSIPGNSIVLTINKNVQAILEEELKEAIKTYGGNSASGIIVDPNTGEILALANAADFDPNNYSRYSDEIRRNRIVTDTYEPGSTFKSISLASLIDRNLCKLSENIFLENGTYRYNNVNIRDSKKHEYLTVRGVFEQSSNIGFAKLIQRMDNESYYKYLRAFGFGTPTSIELPSESKGKLKMPAEWGKLSKAFISYGYEVAVTPVQLAMAYSAIVNGGILYQPRLIKKEISPAGVVLYETSPKEIRRVISDQTSLVMKDLLRGVVENGTGKNAKSDVLSIGGKTGTSQMLINGSYSKQEYNSSFAGFFPADDPRAVCVILVSSPSVGRYGGLVAAPVFKRIAERLAAMNPLEFQPPKRIEDVKDNIKVIYAKENLTDETKEEVKATAKFNGKTNIMPDLSNYSVREAIQVLTKLGIKYKVKGTGKVIYQSVLPGEKLNSSVVCEITCGESNSKKAVVY